MKRLTTIALTLLASLGATAPAADLQKETLETPKGKQLVILVTSGTESVATVKIVKPGTLTMEAENIGFTEGRDAFGPEVTKSYRCTGACKVVLSVDGKPALTLAGDSMYVQPITMPPRQGTPGQAETNRLAPSHAAANYNALYTRIYLVDSPEKLKRVKGLDANKPVQEQALQYLKQQGAEFKQPGYIRFDRTTPQGPALQARGTLAELDKVEMLLQKLRDMP